MVIFGLKTPQINKKEAGVGSLFKINVVNSLNFYLVSSTEIGLVNDGTKMQLYLDKNDRRKKRNF